MIRLEAGPDAGLIWHFGDPLAEQRRLAAGDGIVALENRQVLKLAGPERVIFLNALTTNVFDKAADAFVLDATGRIIHELHGAHDGDNLFVWTYDSGLEAYLQAMKFWTKVTITRENLQVYFVGNHVKADGIEFDYGIDGGRIVLAKPGCLRPDAGIWAFEALRIAAGIPRFSVDTDNKTIPNELGLYATALNKGCYPGQETVAKINNLGHPPRRLVRLNLDGSANRLPDIGEAIILDGETVGFVGASAYHYEAGPIALGLVKRTVPVKAQLSVAGIASLQEPLVDPDIGEHFKAKIASR